MEGVELEFDKFSLNAIVEKAMIKKTGARALRSIVEEFMLDIMYELPNRKDVDKCIITKDVVEKGNEPILIKAEKKSA
ncbi:MAG TPA: ATP-dependent Clp protease ATP-binding subunit ClpX, partial [Ignavibacteriaceae bacterium]